MSKRKAIRAQLKQMLTGLTPAGDNVFSQRATPLWDVPLPAVLIYCESETSSLVFDQSPDGSFRSLKIQVEARAFADENLDDALDDLAEAIETLIKADPSIGGNGSTIELLQTLIDTSYEGEKPFGAIQLNYQLNYVE